MLFIDSSSYKSDSIFLVCFLIASNALAGGSSCLAVAHCPNATPASGSTLFDAQLAWRIMLPVSTMAQAGIVLVCELLGLQYLAQDRLKSIWPALNSPRWGACLGRAFWLEFALLSFLYPTTDDFGGAGG